MQIRIDKRFSVANLPLSDGILILVQFSYTMNAEGYAKRKNGTIDISYLGDAIFFIINLSIKLPKRRTFFY